MLRGCVFALGLALLAGALIAFAAHAVGPGTGMLVMGLLLTVGVIYEKVQYKEILDRVPPGDWRATGERFIDSATQRAVTVYANRKGRRIYVGGETVSDAD